MGDCLGTPCAIGISFGAWRWPLTSVWCQGQGVGVAVPPLPRYALMAWCSVGGAQGPLVFWQIVHVE